MPSTQLLGMELSDLEQLILSIFVRIGATCSIIASCTMIMTIVQNQLYKERRRIYHRIMFGCALNSIVLSMNHLWGIAAVPKDTPGFPSHLIHGTVATCTAQGLFYTLGFVVPCYYVALSLLCYTSLRNKFNIVNYHPHLEMYIHIGVHIFPFTSGIYMLSIEAYNPSISDCYMTSYPVGCGTNTPSGEICIRGPNNWPELARWLVGLPLGIVLLFPAVTMAYTYFTIVRPRLLLAISNNNNNNNNNISQQLRLQQKTKQQQQKQRNNNSQHMMQDDDQAAVKEQHQKSNHLTTTTTTTNTTATATKNITSSSSNNNNNNNSSRRRRRSSIRFERSAKACQRVAASVAKQSLIYLLALYWTYLFRFVFLFVSFKAQTYIFTLHVIGNTIEAMQGVWIALAYYYFRSSSSSSSTSTSSKSKSRLTLPKDPIGNHTTTFAACALAGDSSSRRSNSQYLSKPFQTSGACSTNNNNEYSSRSSFTTSLRGDGNATTPTTAPTPTTKNGKKQSKKFTATTIILGGQVETTTTTTTTTTKSCDEDENDNSHYNHDTNNNNNGNDNDNDDNDSGLLIPNSDNNTIDTTTNPQLQTKTANTTTTSSLPLVSSSNRNFTLVQKPEFSIFDGTGIAVHCNSPWAQYLLDEGEDEDYQQDCGEYDDDAFINFHG